MTTETSSMARKIDDFVFNHCGLTPEKIQLVEGAIS